MATINDLSLIASSLFIILNILMFRPLLALFRERESFVKGSLDAAIEMERNLPPLNN